MTAATPRQSRCAGEAQFTGGSGVAALWAQQIHVIRVTGLGLSLYLLCVDASMCAPPPVLPPPCPLTLYLHLSNAFLRTHKCLGRRSCRRVSLR